MNISQKKIIICDLDGTLANVQHRLHHIKNSDGTMKPYKNRDWDSFNKACVEDEVYKDVREILWDMYDAGRKHGERPTDLQKVSDRFIYFFSGRSEAVRKETEEWLHKWVVSPSTCKEVEINKDEFDEICGNGRAYTTREYNDKYFQLRPYLYMRKEGDFRNDIEVKREMIDSLNITPDDVLCILDDRQGVVDMWRDEGFRCLQVDAWKES